MTLLELMLAMTVMTTMVVAVSGVMRTGYQVWDAQQADMAKITEVNATLRHIVRRVRQAQAVTAISKSNKKDGSLSLLMPSGETLVWEHDKGTDETRFGVDTADSLLCRGLSGLWVFGYAADGVTLTDVPADVHSIRLQAEFELPRETGGARVLSCRAWLRSW